MTKLKVDGDLIRELAAILDETGLTEIEITDNGQGVRIARSAGVASYVAPAAAPASAAPDPAAPAAPDRNAVTSPMVGTVYLSPQPGEPAFVKPGDRVSEGQTLLIIEAMKVMNHIPAPRGGVVQAVLVEDGQPVEYGDPLVVLA